MQFKISKSYYYRRKENGWLGMEAYACPPSYLGGRDWEHRDLRPVQAKSL
jgi:hypothetical protein